jgi:hypothetical protein
MSSAARIVESGPGDSLVRKLRRCEDWYGFSGLADDVEQVIGLVEAYGDENLIRLVREVAYDA